MEEPLFSEQDRLQIRAHGLEEAQVLAQMNYFLDPPKPVRLSKPCTLGDGLLRLDLSEANHLVELQRRVAMEGRCMKFVPASGSASRMFSTLIAHHKAQAPSSQELHGQASARHGPIGELVAFLQGLEKFPFYPELRESMLGAGMEPLELASQGHIRQILDHLLTDAGLGYQDLPKALVLFHRYGEQARTALEEHLVEAAHYVTDGEGICRVHFTVSPGHLERFLREIERVRQLHEPRLGVRFQVGVSLQNPSTDTLAVDLENHPFRSEDGRLLFRPGGHGALLENLQKLDGDIVFIKNVDNVPHERLLKHTVLWKRILGGYLVRLQGQIFELLARLGQDPVAESTIGEAMEFANSILSLPMPKRAELGTAREAAWRLSHFLNRPLRVCAMVENRGEPGGGPFWVEVGPGECPLQIVESVQVDLASPEQREIWESSTHFNPVDMVCGVRDPHGNPYDLMRFADASAVMITRKSSGGRELKALEHPGLWNGGMARWNTVFLEVPEVTFQPVKTVNDLLRPGHQPQG